MKTPLTATFLLALILLAAAGAGCVFPGPIDASAVARYQRYLSVRGPGERTGDREGEILQPARNAAAPKLKVERVKMPDGTERAAVRLTLEDAIRLMLINSPEVRISSFDPAISREQMIQAAAEFDWVVFGSFTYNKEDKQTASIFGGGQSKAQAWSLGVRTKTTTGAEASLSWTLTRAWANALSAVPVTYEPLLAFEIAQPLLRDGWPAFNLARLNLARVTHRTTLAAFRQKVEDLVAQVVVAYLSLAQAHRDYEIQHRLLDETIRMQKIVAARQEGGLTAPLSVDQIDATVASRGANLQAARKLVLDARDRLGRLLADSEANVLSDFEIIPATPMGDADVMRDVEDQLRTALQHNPLLEQARLAIEAEAINVRVARNQALPRLDLTASTTLQGLAGAYHQAWENFFGGSFVGYSVALTGEYPLGNRGRRAEVRRARLSRMKAIATMQNVADTVAQALRERIRQVNTTHVQIQEFDKAIASARGYRDKLEVTISRELGERMTPERLQLYLQAQGLVSDLERSRLQAVTAYNTALIELARTKGTVLRQYRLEVLVPEVREQIAPVTAATKPATQPVTMPATMDASKAE